ncbi:MAG: UDP-glucose/GDP-mannose dehydrogenase family protein [bacterium]|nr:UDP-glucose/GDP-mannose dehydrogenase family protein [Candidatus Kapabacteria bacterium]
MPYNIAVVGTGYVGLVTGVCLAETGNQVTCVDIDPVKIEKLEAGEVPIYEPGLDKLLERSIRERRIRFTLNLEDAVLASEIVFLCLPTPPDGDGAADLQYVLGVAEQIGLILAANPTTSYKVLVDKSTVPVGTSERVRDIIHQRAPDAEFDVVSNPEFLREGFAVEDCLRPERIVVGTTSKRAAEIMSDLFGSFVRSGNPIYITSERSAELAKYAANSFIAMRISFINEMANLCEDLGADIDDLRRILGSDSRIGKRYLFPGLGYGGSCFPKDVKAILRTASENQSKLEVIAAVERANKAQPGRFFDKIVAHFGGSVAGLRFAAWGLAFKANTDDVRDSPAFAIIDLLLEAGAEVNAYDPEAVEPSRKHYGDTIRFGSSMYETTRDADALVILTEWNEFRNPDLTRLASSLKQPVIFDGRNLLESEDLIARGFKYYAVGRAIDTARVES